MYFSNATVVGRLGAKPELKPIPSSGKMVASFRVAVTEFFTKGGQKETKTVWHTVEAWGKLAELCGQYLDKGDEVLVHGRLTTEEWTDKTTGKQVSRHKIVANDVGFPKKKEDKPAEPEETPDTLPF